MIPPPVRTGNPVAHVVGALTAGRRRGDGIIRLGAFGAVTFAVLRLLESNLDADRAQRAVQQEQMMKAVGALTTSIQQLERVTADHAAQQEIVGALILERYGKRPDK